MAITFKMDGVAQAQISEVPGQWAVVRKGWAFGLTTLGLTKPQVMAAVIPALEAFGSGGDQFTLNSPYPATRYASCLLKERYIDGTPSNSRKVGITLIYKSVGPAFPPVTFILSRETVTRRVATELDPITLKPISVTWRDPNNSKRVVTRLAEIEIDKTFQRLVASGWYKGTPPPDALLNAHNTVNDQTWRGLPKGYWHYRAESDTTRDYGGSYNISMEFETKRDEPWYYFATMRIPGLYIKIPDFIINDMRTSAYQPGMRQFNGITRVCPYLMSDFGSLFGFGNIGA